MCIYLFESASRYCSYIVNGYMSLKSLNLQVPCSIFFFPPLNHSLCNLHVKETYVCPIVFPTPGFSLRLVAQSCPTVCDPMDFSLPGSSVHGDSPGKNIGVGCHALLEGIFPIQGSHPGLLHCRGILYHLRHQGSP